MQLIIHRGTKEIGGSCVELATTRTRLVLDLGLPLVDADREPFDARAALRKTREELIQDGTLPKVSGLFDRGSSPPDAILLSHAHLDHSGLLPLSRRDVPIYASKGTSKMMLAGALFSAQTELDRTRHREVIPRRSFPIGDFQITPFAVDHSTYGSLAFLIQAEGKTVLYSGDIRLHGRKPGMAKALLRKVAANPVDVLIMEGTHFGSEKVSGLTEYELEEEIVGHVRSAKSIVLAAFSPLDLDRLVTFYRAAQRSDRVFVVDAYAAFVFYLVARDAKVPGPTRENGIRVFFNHAFERKKNEKVRQKFPAADRIMLDEVLQRPEKHLMVFRPSMTGPDFSGKLPSGCRCIYSSWKGYLAKPDWTDVQRQIAEVGGEFMAAHASGHIYIADLIEFVTAVNARTVIPIHTFEPEMFKDHFANVRVLHDAEPAGI